MATKAGWYPSATIAGQLQWWNGNEWTANYSPLVAMPGPTTVVMVGRHQTSHGFHLMMTLLTLGLWIPIWIIVGISNAVRN